VEVRAGVGGRGPWRGGEEPIVSLDLFVPSDLSLDYESQGLYH
jgi:hypothetical protein